MSEIKLNQFNKNLAPLQIVHDFQFVALNVEEDYSFVEDMKLEEKINFFKRRVKTLYDTGYSGIIMNCDYKDYLTEDSFAWAYDVAEYAKGLGMRVWLYDEQYYPSGSAGGLTLKNHPELEAQCLACVSKTFEVTEAAVRVPSPTGYSGLKYAVAVPVKNGQPDFENKKNISNCVDLAGGLCWDAPQGTWKVYCFFVRVMFELTKLAQGTRATRRYLNIYNPEAVKRFIDITFTEGYEKYTSEPIGNLFEAVFTDEPHSFLYEKFFADKKTFYPSFSVYDQPNHEICILPYIPWDGAIPEKFQERYGYSLIEYLPDIFENTTHTERVRVDFYGLLGFLAQKAFPAQFKERLSSLGIALSGHYYGEEGFDNHPFFYGDILEHLGEMDVPGSDNLHSDADFLRYCSACKLASSAAHLYGKEKVMIEASNMVDEDQNLTLEKLKGAVSMMFVHGVNTITSYYGENILTFEERKEFTRYTALLASLLDGGKYKINTLLYYPFEQVCAAYVPQGTDGKITIPLSDNFLVGKTSAELMKNQVCFDFVNKKKLLECEIKEGYVLTSYGQKVYNLVFPAIDNVDVELAQFLSSAKKNGVGIFFAGNKRKIKNLDFVPEFDVQSKAIKKELCLNGQYPLVTHMQCSFEEYDLYMLLNTGNEKVTIEVLIPFENRNFKGVDLNTGELCTIEYSVVGEQIKCLAEIPPITAIIVCGY